jgi:ABC-type Fe3+/spermidine/putrescine transport system ATPase subunit
MGETNWLSATVETSTATALVLRTECGPIQAQPKPELQPGRTVRLGFRPEALQIGPASVNAFSVTVTQVSYLGETEQYTLQLTPAIALKAIEQNPQEIRRPGMTVTVHITPQNVLVFAASPGQGQSP